MSTQREYYTDGPLAVEDLASIKTIGDLDQIRSEIFWVSRSGSYFETSGVGLTRYGALKVLFGTELAKQTRKIIRLESSALLPETTLDGAYIAMIPV